MVVPFIRGQRNLPIPTDSVGTRKYLAPSITKQTAMAYTSVYQRHQSIINLLRRRKHQRHTTSSIHSYLQGLGMGFSVRTVERDIKLINEKMGNCIVTKGARPHHWYAFEEADGTSLVGNFLDHATLTDIIGEELELSGQGEQVIYMDETRIAHGLEHMPMLAKAARRRNRVRVVHRKFGDGEPTERVVCPLFLKQFQQRWYLVAREQQSNEIRSFGLERIVEVEVLSESFPKRKGETHEELYGHVFGLFEREHDPVTVRLWSSHFHADYLRTLPLHPTQEEEEGEQDGGVVFSFFLTPNYEFLQAVLRMERNVMLLSPAHAVIELREMLEEMLDMYR